MGQVDPHLYYPPFPAGETVAVFDEAFQLLSSLFEEKAGTSCLAWVLITAYGGASHP
jgi:hypothetical protein